MNIIRVISTKTPMNSIHDVYLPLSTLQNTLTDSAKLYNGGYISSQSYFPIISDPHDTIKLYNISEWKNRNYWRIFSRFSSNYLLVVYISRHGTSGPGILCPSLSPSKINSILGCSGTEWLFAAKYC